MGASMVAPSRQLALDMGARFYQGSPCGRGHAGLRYAGNKACVQCSAAYGKAWKAAHRLSERARKKPQKRRRAAELALQRHEYARLLAARDAMPAGAVPELIAPIAEPSLPSVRRRRPYKPRQAARMPELGPYARLIFGILGFQNSTYC